VKEHQEQHEEAGEGGGKVRLQRVLADAGVAARRVCEALIEEGHVAVNGKTVTRLPIFVDPENDRITVDGKGIRRSGVRRLYIMLNKPSRMLTTTADEPGLDRATIMELVDHPARARLVPVGRLDFHTAGLVLLTNDGAMVNRLTHPRYGVPKTYRCVLKGTWDEAKVSRLELVLNRAQKKDDRRIGRVAPSAGSRVRLGIVKQQRGTTTLAITLREGRTGNIAKMLAGAGAPVRSLERVAMGPLELVGVARGQWRELERGEVQALKKAMRGRTDETKALTQRERAIHVPMEK
jgi:pseudouridine synthase